MSYFGYPETNKTRCASIVSKTRKLPDGTFEAVAAFFFGGIRKNQKTAIANTRHAAIKAAEVLIGYNRNEKGY